MVTIIGIVAIRSCGKVFSVEKIVASHSHPDSDIKFIHGHGHSFRAAAPRGSVTYAFTHVGNFLLFGQRP